MTLTEFFYLTFFGRAVEAERLKKLEASIQELLKETKAMTTGQENLKKEVKELREAVDTYTSQAGQRTEAAIAAARQAWEQDNEEAFNEAAAELDAIAKTLQNENPADVEGGEFDPSAN
jgi:seryl-tRNA synthetase